ncbi:MAG TPA: lysylphosphatidylglycerol synthase domain-containing protein [Methylomirabilota bacterium]|jgi:uncharacterized protein (TIRG00374 family)|nr:lysylphosphatidylglycerol synthase domain-containing protein [Methylomirabilota bacterium]
MRALRTVSLLAGLAILAFLVIRVGTDATLASVARALGWQFLLICLPSCLVMAVDTLAWRYCFRDDRVPFHRLVAARAAGEAVNVITAVVPVGGDAVKVWLLRPHVPYRESVASVIIAKTTITIAQVLFLLVGVGLAWSLSLDRRLLTGMLWLLLIEVVCVGGLFLVQIAGLVTRSARLFSRVGFLQALTSAEDLDRALQDFYRRQWRRFALSVGFHLAGWLLGVIETLLVLRVLGLSASVGAGLVIEALGSAVRFATFFVPGSVGALEGANTGAFIALGLGGSAGLAFSLVRRGRQLVWIAIGLVVLAATHVRDRLAYARAHRFPG